MGISKKVKNIIETLINNLPPKLHGLAFRAKKGLSILLRRFVPTSSCRSRRRRSVGRSPREKCRTRRRCRKSDRVSLSPPVNSKNFLEFDSLKYCNCFIMGFRLSLTSTIEIQNGGEWSGCPGFELMTSKSQTYQPSPLPLHYVV